MATFFKANLPTITNSEGNRTADFLLLLMVCFCKLFSCTNFFHRFVTCMGQPCLKTALSRPTNCSEIDCNLHRGSLKYHHHHPIYLTVMAMNTSKGQSSFCRPFHGFYNFSRSLVSETH